MVSDDGGCEDSRGDNGGGRGSDNVFGYYTDIES